MKESLNMYRLKVNYEQAFHGKKGEDKYIWSFTPIEKKD